LDSPKSSGSVSPKKAPTVQRKPSGSNLATVTESKDEADEDSAASSKNPSASGSKLIQRKLSGSLATVVESPGIPRRRSSTSSTPSPVSSPRTDASDLDSEVVRSKPNQTKPDEHFQPFPPKALT